MALKIDRNICTSCGDCEPICPTKSIKPFKGAYKIDEATCTECQGEHEQPQCMKVCLEDGCIDYV